MKIQKLTNIIINLRRIYLDQSWIFFESLINRFLFFQNITLKYTNLRREIVKEEIKMAGITANDKVLIVGCGPMPYTAIGYAEESNANIESIDKNSKVVESVNEFVQKNNLQNKFKIKYGDVLNFTISQYDVIVIGITVWPIDKILPVIIDKINIDTKVICREINNDISSIISMSDLINHCRIESQVYHPSGKRYKSLLLRRIN